MSYLLLMALSFGVGIIVGLTGMGGASLITPMLIFVFHVPASVAIGSDVVAATLMKIMGAIHHWQQQTVNYQIVKWFACGSVPGALLGISCLHALQQTGTVDLDSLLLHLLGFAILLIAAIALLQIGLKIALPQLQQPTLPTLDLATYKGRVGAIAIGFILGLLVGMTSVSSGSLFALALIVFFRLDAHKLVGTDLMQAAVLLSVTSLGHLSLGMVNWGLVLPIWLGSLPGVWVGAQLCQMVPQRPLRFVIYTILVVVSWRLVDVM
jgi:hypothetical protein